MNGVRTRQKEKKGYYKHRNSVRASSYIVEVLSLWYGDYKFAGRSEVFSSMSRANYLSRQARNRLCPANLVTYLHCFHIPRHAHLYRGPALASGQNAEAKSDFLIF
jgi:hypothetical protein